MTEPLRYRLVLGKYRVTKVDRTTFLCTIVVDLLGAKLMADVPVNSDVKVGDILTLYTEILTNANPPLLS